MQKWNICTSMQIVNYLSFDKFLIFSKKYSLFIIQVLGTYLINAKWKKNSIMTFEDHSLKKQTLSYY